MHVHACVCVCVCVCVHSNVLFVDDAKALLKQLLIIRKKLEFFVSWCVDRGSHELSCLEAPIHLIYGKKRSFDCPHVKVLLQINWKVKKKQELKMQKHAINYFMQ